MEASAAHMNDWPWQVELDPPPDPLTVFRHLAHTPFALFLDSALVTRRDQQTTGVHPATRVSPLGRYSFITAFPFATLIIQDGQSQYTQASAGLAAISAADPFVLLQQRWRSFARQPQPIRADLPPFQGGVAGCWGYELAHRLERIPHGAGLEARPDANLPDMALGFYDWALAWDHADPGGARCWLFANGWPAAEPAARQRRAQERIEQILALIGRPAPPLPPWTVSPGTAAGDQRRSAPRFSVPGHANLTSTFKLQMGSTISFWRQRDCTQKINTERLDFDEDNEQQLLLMQVIRLMAETDRGHRSITPLMDSHAPKPC